MRDFKILVAENEGVDIDIIDGQAEYLQYEAQTGDQRAALSVYCIKGSIPGNLDFGVSWGLEFTQSNTVTQLNNEIQQQIQECAGMHSTDTMQPSDMYTATLIPQGGQIGVLITR